MRRERQPRETSIHFPLLRWFACVFDSSSLLVKLIGLRLYQRLAFDGTCECKTAIVAAVKYLKLNSSFGPTVGNIEAKSNLKYHANDKEA